MRKNIIVCVLCTSIVLSGCSLGTPMGTLHVSFDEETKTDKVVYEDEEGNVQEFDTDNISGQIDNMLDDVDLPNGATNGELKQFVHEGMDNLGITDTINTIENNLNELEATVVENETEVENEDN